MSLICPICQDNLINGESIDNYVNKCGHVYHSACLLPWWDSAPEEPNCPECRQPCNMDTITKIFLTVDHSEVDNYQTQDTPFATGDLKTQALVRQIKERIDVQTYAQTKDINDKFRQQNSDFSTLLLNSNHRLTSNYNDKLSAVSKELIEMISDEHNRLLTELDSQPRPGNSRSYNISDETDHSTDDKRSMKPRFRNSFWTYWQSKPASYITPITAILCLIAIIVVIVYSHFILQTVKSSQSSDQMKTNNVSLRLEMLSQELYHIANDVSQDIKSIKFDLENLRESIKKGANSKEIWNRLGEVSRKEDELLLEQIQTDRRVNLKLEVLHNSMNMLKAQMDSVNSTDAQQQSINRIKLGQLEEQNKRLEAKLEHLQMVLTEGRNLNAVDLVKQIENDKELSAHTGQDDKSIWEEPSELWRKFTDSISMGANSSSVGITGTAIWVFVCASSTMLFSIFIV